MDLLFSKAYFKINIASTLSKSQSKKQCELCWKWHFDLTAGMQCSIYNYQPIKSPCKTVGCKSVSIVRVWTFFWSSMTSKDVFFYYFRVIFFYHFKIYVICQCVCWHSIYCSIANLTASSEWVSEWLLFKSNSAIFQLYHGENNLIFNKMMVRSALC
jgi:hypothetical protein